MYSHLHGVLHCILLFPSRELLKCFTTTELINWKQLCTTYESELKFGSASSPATHVFNTKLEGGAKRWTDLKNRVVEHVSIWYTTLISCIMMYWEGGGRKKGCFLINVNLHDCALYMHASVGQSILRCWKSCTFDLVTLVFDCLYLFTVGCQIKHMHMFNLLFI